MHKIQKLSIKNFKILKNVQDIEIGNFTLITGVNSSGKSTFIQSLLLLKENQELINQLLTNSMLEATIDSQPEDLKNHMLKFFENKKNEPISLEGEYINLGDKKDIFNQDIYEENIDIIIDIHLLGEAPFSIKYNNISLDTTYKFPLSNVLNLFADDFQYINTDRIQPNRTYKLSLQHIRKKLIGIKGEYTAHFLDEYRYNPLNIEALKHPNAKTNRLLENVSLWLSEISSGIEVIPKKHLDLHQVSLSYQYTYGNNTTNELSPLNVGFGITYVLPIIVAILKTKPNDLLIIENPESHLHPAGQSKIAELCAIASSNEVQIIVETHSEHFLNGIRLATKKQLINTEDTKIYYFEKDNETMSSKIYSLTIDVNGRINEAWPKGFFDEYDKQLDELIEW